MLPPRHSRSAVLSWLALALACGAVPVSAHAQQDTLKVPAASAPPRATLPAGTRITRPPLATPGIAPRTAAQQLVQVPDLSGRTVAEARRLLAAAGLELGRVAEGTGSGTPGTVMQQQPRGGSVVAPKSDVRLWLVPGTVATNPTRPPVDPPVLSRPPVQRPPVEQPPSRVTVPRLVGRTVEEARGILGQATLEVASVGELAVAGTPGTIVRQSPRAGSAVAPRSGVQLWVVPARVAQQPRDTPAAAPAVRVPSLVGQTMEDARETLAAAGLGVGVLAEAAGAGTPGTVTRQQPAAGSTVSPNSRVRLWLVPARRAIMPAIMGLPLDRAQALVRRAGLTPGQVGGEGRVIGHTFEAGASVPVGSVVNISLGVPPGSVGQVATGPVDPRPGTETPGEDPRTSAPGAPATRTPPPADFGAVPDVRRLALPRAQAALAAAGFAAAFDTALADSTGWMVSAQQPSPGGQLAAGGVVALLLDPPARTAAVAGPTTQPPLANGLQPGNGGPVVQPPLLERRGLWIALAALLLVVAAAAGAQRMRARKRLLPVAGVSARLRMDAPAHVAVEGAPFGAGRLRFRMNPGRSAAHLSAAGPLFVRKEVSGD